MVQPSQKIDEYNTLQAFLAHGTVLHATFVFAILFTIVHSRTKEDKNRIEALPVNVRTLC